MNRLAPTLVSRLPIWNGPPNPSGRNWFTVKDSATETDTVEILIYDQIGKDWYSEDGVSAKDFDTALKAIASDKKILVRINSPGGNVWDGLAIYNMLKARGEKVTCRVDGIAASIASVICMAGHRVEMPANSMLMMHEPSSLCGGNSEDMRRMADLLDQHADVIANTYAQRSGKSKETMRAFMRAETWMSGDDAKKQNLCDDVTAQVSLTASLNSFDLSSFRHVPETLKNKSGTSPNPTPAPVMNRQQLIKLLNTLKVTFNNSATDEELFALVMAYTPPTAAAASAPAGGPATTPAPTTAPAAAGASAPSNVIDVTAAITAALAPVTAQLAAAKKEKITNIINGLVENNQLTAAEAPAAIARASQDESYLTELSARPAILPGAEPVSAQVDVVGNSPKEIEQGILRNWGGNTILTAQQAGERGRVRAAIIAKHLDRLMPILNTNTVSSDLKRTVILQQAIRAFAIKVMALANFSTRLNGFKLEGTDKVAVPYFALNTTASTAFVAANGYDTFGNTNSDAKTVTIDKRQYQGLKWTSSELARQPFMDVLMGAALLAEQLGLDVVNDVLSLVTLATYGASVKAENAAAFDTDDVIDLKGVADLANWPGIGRSLMLNSSYDVSLLKDKAIKDSSAWGDNAPIREGRIFRLSGFDYMGDARVPSNSENLEGFIAWKSAILVAFAPVDPTPEVRQQLSRYEVITEPTTGATFEYRLWGNPDMDQTREIIEANYGKVAGEAAALKRITNQ